MTKQTHTRATKKGNKIYCHYSQCSKHDIYTWQQRQNQKASINTRHNSSGEDKEEERAKNQMVPVISTNQVY